MTDERPIVLRYLSQPLVAWTLLILAGVYYLRTCVCIPLFYATRNDFGHLVVGGYLASHGADVYDWEWMRKAAMQLHIPRLNPFVYPPFMAVCMIPLAWFSYDGAWVAWSLFSHGLMLGAGFLLRKIVIAQHGGEDRLGGPLWWASWLVVLALFYPWFRSIDAGQFNAIVLFGLVLAQWWLLKQRDLYAGATLGLLAGLKVSPVLLLFWLLVWRRPRAVAAGLIALALTVMVGLYQLGWDSLGTFMEIARQMQYGSSTWGAVMQFHVEPANQAPSSIWYRIFSENNWTHCWLNSPRLAYSLSVITALLIMGLTAWKTWGKWSVENYWLGVASMLLVPSLCWDHYLVQWLPVLFLLVLNQPRLSLLSLGLVSTAAVLMGIPFAYELENWKHGWLILVPAHKLLGVIVTYFVLFCNLPKTSEV